MQPQESRRARKGDAGPPGYRRRFSSVSQTVTLSVILTRDQRSVFDNFRRDTCADGSLAFWMPDPATDGWPLLGSDGSPLLTGDGQPLLMGGRWLCLWGDQLPTESIVRQVMFQKTFNVVVMP